MKKRRHVETCEDEAPTASNEGDKLEQEPIGHKQQELEIPTSNKPVGKNDQSHERHRPKKMKAAFARVQVDPSKRYKQPESRESWGPNVKGKKFRKEKGKKKRCGNAGVRIDGAVKSIRLDV